MRTRSASVGVLIGLLIGAVVRPTARAEEPPGDLAAFGASFRQALREAARGIDKIPNATRRVDARCYIGVAQVRADDRTEARATLRQVLKDARRGEDSLSRPLAKILADAAWGLAKLGDREGYREALRLAWQAAGAAEDDDLKISALEDIGRAQARSGEVEASRDTFRMAIALVERQEKAEDKVCRLANLAGTQAELDDREEANQTFRRAIRLLPDVKSPEFLFAYSRVFRTQLRARAFDEALRFLLGPGFHQEYERPSLLESMADAVTSEDGERAGKILDRLRQLAGTIRDEDERASLQSRIALAEVRLGHWETAGQMAEALAKRSGDHQAEILIAIAQAKLRAGNRTGARNLLDRATGLLRGNTLSLDGMTKVAVAWAEFGNLEVAEEMIRATDRWENGDRNKPDFDHWKDNLLEARFKLWTALAWAQSEAGDRKAARRSIRQAVEALKSITPLTLHLGPERVMVASVQASVGDLDAAIEECASIVDIPGDPADRADEQAVGRVLGILARAGDQDGVRKFLRAFPEAKAKAAVFTRPMMAVPAGETVLQAPDLPRPPGAEGERKELPPNPKLGRVGDPPPIQFGGVEMTAQECALQYLPPAAKREAAEGRAEETLVWARAVDDPFLRARVLGAIAEGLAGREATARREGR